MIPAPIRVRNSVSALNARPDSITIAANSTLAHATTRVRRKRSASHPIGTAPNTRKAPDAELMNTIAPLLMCSESRMSGESVPRVALSRLSSATREARVTNVALPPRCSASRSETSASPTPGSASSATVGRWSTLRRSASSSRIVPASWSARSSLIAFVNGYFACSKALVEGFHSYT